MSVAAELSRRLARSAEAVCRYYLPAGRREGRYWLVGNVDNRPGRSLFVRLVGSPSGGGAAGRWQDAATGEHGDLLDLIAARKHLSTLRDTLYEARRFLLDPPLTSAIPLQPAPRNSSLAAQRLFAAAKPLHDTLGARHLRGRGIISLPDPASVRFHPRCFRRPDPGDADTRQDWPALIAAVTDLGGRITGVQNALGSTRPALARRLSQHQDASSAKSIAMAFALAPPATSSRPAKGWRRCCRCARSCRRCRPLPPVRPVT